MDLGQGLHHRRQDGQGLFVRDLPALGGDVRLQAHALDVLHDEISRMVLFKIVLHRNDVGRVLELGQNPRLLQKPLHAVLILLLAQPGERHAVPVGMAGGKARGHILLDGHLDLQGQVVAQIGDAEPAYAQDFSGHIPAVEQGAQGQGQKRLLRLLVKPTVGADRGALRFFLKAAIADLF